MLPSSVAMSEPSDTLVRISHLRSIEALGRAIGRHGHSGPACVACQPYSMRAKGGIMTAGPSSPGDQGASLTTELKVSLDPYRFGVQVLHETCQ